MTEFKVGTLVRLRSGGPRMTVNRHVGDLVHCVWHTSLGMMLQDSVASLALVKVGSVKDPGETRGEA